ncbi:hypothetical protein [Streptomyces sp. NPDC056949]|uniref:hypothetical protein n=1 Tax=Streptomyces sp. NPDC056949 TaxID=3345976 RepID=UPI00363568A1
MFSEGRHRGDLEPSLEEAEPYALSDALVLIGLALIAVGLIGGTIRASMRLAGVRAKTLARARKLYEAADQAAGDHAQARDVVRVARNELRREQIDAKLSAVPVARLMKGAAVSRTVRDMEAAGVRTARDVLDAGVLGPGHVGVDRRSALLLDDMPLAGAVTGATCRVPGGGRCGPSGRSASGPHRR